MRWPTMFTLCASAAVAVILAAQTPAPPTPNPPSKDTPAVESKGMPPRAAPTDYAAHAQAGAVTIAADFTGHNAHTQEGILTTDDFVVIEAGIFGPPEAKLMLSVDDFSLRINGGKRVLPAQPFDLVARSLKDPDYERPESKESKTILTGTGEKTPGVDPNAPPAALPPIPFEIKRGWQQRAKRDSLLIGDRALPQAGLLFFSYGGGTKGIRSIELIYSGPAGKATLAIHP